MCSLSGLFQPFQPLTLHRIDLATCASGSRGEAHLSRSGGLNGGPQSTGEVCAMLL